MVSRSTSPLRMAAESVSFGPLTTVSTGQPVSRVNRSLSACHMPLRVMPPMIATRTGGLPAGSVARGRPQPLTVARTRTARISKTRAW